jgi:hypothetical protein
MVHLISIPTLQFIIVLCSRLYQSHDFPPYLRSRSILSSCFSIVLASIASAGGFKTHRIQITNKVIILTVTFAVILRGWSPFIILRPLISTPFFLILNSIESCESITVSSILSSSPASFHSDEIVMDLSRSIYFTYLPKQYIQSADLLTASAIVANSEGTRIRHFH